MLNIVDNFFAEGKENRFNEVFVWVGSVINIIDIIVLIVDFGLVLKI